MRLFLALTLLLALPFTALADGPAARESSHTGKPRLVSLNGKRLRGEYQKWVDRSLVPVVSGKIKVGLRGCPGRPRSAGCVLSRQPDTLYVLASMSRDRKRATLFHELGHLFDFRVMNSRQRRGFKRLLATSRPWFSRARAPLGEQFAEAYSFCARYRNINSIRAHASHDYDPTPEQHTRVCDLIRRAAKHDQEPNPPSNPPRNTNPDPPPPEQPPEDPEFVPGLPPPPTGGLPPTLPLPLP